ncbi:MAG: hypothetical protein M1828_006350 [Chrysothrix sp. TS-e1954]|nr:MAG: hypothetical protein M1828_006350 [Chrysothrix sp. TS-e1954]
MSVVLATQANSLTTRIDVILARRLLIFAARTPVDSALNDRLNNALAWCHVLLADVETFCRQLVQYIQQHMPQSGGALEGHDLAVADAYMRIVLERVEDLERRQGEVLDAVEEERSLRHG